MESGMYRREWKGKEEEKRKEMRGLKEKGKEQEERTEVKRQKSEDRRQEIKDKRYNIKLN